DPVSRRTADGSIPAWWYSRRMRPTTAASVNAASLPPDGAVAKDPFERPRDFLGQPRRLGQPGRPRHFGHHDRLGRGAVAAIAASRLAEPAHQPHAAAPAALVEIGLPVVNALAGGADQNLLVAPDAALPRAVPPDRVHLPYATAIAGHPSRSFAVPR